ncbi:endo-1,4-beta-xylanase 5-like [Impatiens glandulifera]|uniref:endo-1,4-beta-xylanase 5-like n=1 Tax=Impatiens glandulifera TaxID=253017 RepID=UPI001FB0EACD|nr:endo-1,4-beta-xylanase 5-like [Impatiens glandulifera]
MSNLELKRCLAKPLKPQYRGGIATNPELDRGLEGWNGFGDSKIECRESDDHNNKFIVAHERVHVFHSPSQEFFLEKDKIYTFSAWLQVSNGNESIFAIFKSQSALHKAGIVVAHSGCWSMLKGGISVHKSERFELYFESNNTNIEIWVDNISLQPFTLQQWRSHIDQSVEKVRKKHVKLQLVDVNGKPLVNTPFKISQRSNGFQFGCSSDSSILSNLGYQNWFTSRRFTVTTFENEMKWYFTEPKRGVEDYSVADDMLKWAKEHRISVRGHNILWDNPKYQVEWLNSLSNNDFEQAVDKRINSIVSRYAGQLIAWDVVNENLHFNYFESRLGSNVNLYSMTSEKDPRTPLFLNEFNTIEEPTDMVSSPDKYIQKIHQIRATGYNGPLGIGLQGHFNTPNLAYMRASIDKLATTGLPIWLTEVDVGGSGPIQATYLDQVLKEGHGHPAVQGIVIWAGWSPKGCSRMCLTDNSFKNLPTGDVVDKFFSESRLIEDLSVMTDDMGYFETKLFHGDYTLRINFSNLSLNHFSGAKESDFQVTNVFDITQSVQVITI